jgi:cation diffusion facilitator family transporter
VEKPEKIAFLSILTNLFLATLKCLLALLSGSVAIIADAIHSGTDVISSALVFFGIKISKRHSKTFPYGLYKVENFVSLITSFLIFLAGYEIAKEAFMKGDVYLRHVPLAMAGILLTTLVTYAFSRYEIKMGKKMNSPSLVADAQHIRTDMFSSVVILAGLAGQNMGLPLDRIAALIVVVFIFRSGGIILLDAVRVLLDASIDFKTMEKVKELILAEHQVTEVKKLLGRSSGPYRFIEADITMKVKDLKKAHFISERIERNIRQNISNVDHVIIHYEPEVKELVTYAIPLSSNKKNVFRRFGEAPYFHIFTIGTRDKSVVKGETLPNPYVNEERRKGIYVSEWLVENGVDVVLLKEKLSGKGPEYVLSDAGVEVAIIEARSVDEAMTNLQR